MFAPSVALVCTHDFSKVGPISADERLYLRGATTQRCMEFVTGRRCAIAALKSIGVTTQTLGRRSDRVPAWPAGTIGSITHCDGLCAAAVSLTRTARLLAVDAEPNSALPHGVLERIGLSREISWVRAAKSNTQLRIAFDRFLFSAKECVFKALYPQVKYYFDFDEVEIRLAADEERFSAHLSKFLQAEVGIDRLEGRVAVIGSHMMTAVHLTAD